MWSYYGSKSKIIDLYPPPKHGKIIEPFAGSARYALKYFDREVLLVDKYDVVIKIWKWLQQCSENDILNLPSMPTGTDLRECNLSEPELLFLGMCAGISSTTPRYKVSFFAGEQNGFKNRYKRIADQLFKIRHWEIKEGCYQEIENQTATWFIDPPYQVGGHAYKVNYIDYEHLSHWSQERSGQVIVCENTQADWLPFKGIFESRGANQKYTTEAIWCNEQTPFDFQQQTLF